MMSNFESRAPEGYVCPVCIGLRGGEGETLISPEDIFYKDEQVSALINSFWQKGNEGHAIVVPNEHYENIYTLSAEVGHRIFDVAQKVAQAIRIAYEADGITTRQNNEPAGDQHAFHYHIHIFPRYDDDNFNNVKPEDKFLAEPEARVNYAEKLRTAMGET